jgi:multiple sugar transport system permease protein
VTLYVPLFVFVFVLLFPFYWMGTTSLKPNAELLSREGNPSGSRTHVRALQAPHLRDALSGVDVEHHHRLGGGHVHIAHGERLRGVRDRAAALLRRQADGLAIFMAYLVPPSILFIPLATIVFQLGLFDTRWAFILTYPTFLIPFCTWLLMGYFRSIPFELEECALIDGATRWQILVKIILPLAVPGSSRRASSPSRSRGTSSSTRSRSCRPQR